MPAPPSLAHSKGLVNRSGEYLVKVLFTEESPDIDRVEEAWQVVSDYRSAHSYPLTKVTMGVRSMVRTETKSAPRIVVGQRLKRMPRLVRKLHRMDGSNLARLEDVGGCRAVLRNITELERVRRRLKQRWSSDIVRERDYIAEPKDVGYRAVHLVVLRDDRRIEVQLRTDRQQAWADAVEQADSRLSLNLKDGEGPVEMMTFFTAAGAVMAALDRGVTPTAELEAALQEAREDVIAAGYYAR